MNPRLSLRRAVLLGGAALAVSPAAAEPYHLGISVSADWASRTYADLMLMAPPMWRTNQGWVFAPMDADGWPTTDGEYYVHDPNYAGPMNTMAGRYRMSFRGRATVALKWGGGSIAAQTYDAAANLTTIDWNITAARPSLWFTFAGTRRTNASPTNTGVTHVRLMRPRALGGLEPYADGALFSEAYLEAHRRGRVLRMMDFTATNWNLQRRWSERPLPGDPTFNSFRADGYGWQGRGRPWEHAIDLCNLLGKDLWVNVPHRADDDYVRELARLIRGRLHAGLKVYVEYSNETWNPMFSQSTESFDWAKAEVAAGNSDLNWDGATWDRIWHARWLARRVRQISEIFRAEFGDDQMIVRVRPLLTTQSVWQHWIMHGLRYLDDVGNNGAGSFTAQPRPVNQVIWGAGGAGYYAGLDGAKLDAATNLDQIFAEYDAKYPAFAAFMAYDAHWCAAFGLRRVAYESGPGADDSGTNDALKKQAQVDPRMKQVYRRMLDTFYEAGGDLWVHFLGVNENHGLLPWDAAGNQPRPKQEAFDEADAAAARPAPTLGRAVPFTANLGRADVAHDRDRAGTSDSPVAFNQRGIWTSHTFRLGTPGALAISLETASGTGSAVVELGGRPVGTLAVPSATPLVAPSVPAGLGAVRVRWASGNFSLRTLSVAPAPTRTVSGRVVLGDWGASPEGQVVRIAVRDPATGQDRQVEDVVLNATGNYSFATPFAGAHHLMARGRTWLQARRANVNLTGTSVVGQNFTLVNGDVDGDNAVTVFDYDRLSAAFDTSAGQSGFDVAADLDGDGAVTVFDYDILSRNFDRAGVD